MFSVLPLTYNEKREYFLPVPVGDASIIFAEEIDMLNLQQDIEPRS